MTINPGDRGHVAEHNLIDARLDALEALPPGTSDPAVAALVADPDSDTATALNNTYGALGRRLASTPDSFSPTRRLRSSNATIGLLLAGMDGVTPGRLYGRDLTNGNFSQSDDWGVTWSHLRGKPANTYGFNGSEKVVRFGDYIWTIKQDLTSGLYGVYRSPAGAATVAYTWSEQLFTLAAGFHANVKTNWNAGSQYLFIGTYSDPGVNSPSIYRISLADANGAGTNFQTVWGPDAATHHVHAVAEDPYNPGHVYAVLGDNGAPVAVLRSTSNGDLGTWTPIISNTGNVWQSVQISFSPTWVWLASDHMGFSVGVFDRDDLIIYNAAMNWHARIPVPGGAPMRTVTDLATTSGSSTVTSATAAFTSADRGKRLSSQPIPESSQSGDASSVSTYIVAVNSATSVTLNAAAGATTTNQPATIGPDEFYSIGYYGAVDPDTETYYMAAMDTSASGTTQGIFYLPYVGGALQLLEAKPVNGVSEFFIGNGFVWSGARFWTPFNTALVAAAGN